MKDYLEIGCSPHEERCVPVNKHVDYIQAMRHECKVFRDQLIRHYGEPPRGAWLTLKRSEHDYGTYYEVTCQFDDENPESSDYAFKLESGLDYWDEQSKKELNASKEWVDFWREYGDHTNKS